MELSLPKKIAAVDRINDYRKCYIRMESSQGDCIPMLSDVLALFLFTVDVGVVRATDNHKRSWYSGFTEDNKRSWYSGFTEDHKRSRK